MDKQHLPLTLLPRLPEGDGQSTWPGVPGSSQGKPKSQTQAGPKKSPSEGLASLPQPSWKGSENEERIKTSQDRVRGTQNREYLDQSSIRSFHAYPCDRFICPLQIHVETYSPKLEGWSLPSNKVMRASLSRKDQHTEETSTRLKGTLPCSSAFHRSRQPRQQGSRNHPHQTLIPLP